MFNELKEDLAKVSFGKKFIAKILALINPEEGEQMEPQVAHKRQPKQQRQK